MKNIIYSKYSDSQTYANSVNSDQTAPEERSDQFYTVCLSIKILNAPD